MKILCIADHVDPLVYSSAVKTRFKDCSFVLSAGDLPMEYYEFVTSALNKPLLFVFGNHNLEKFDQYRKVENYDAHDVFLDPRVLFGYGSTYIGGRAKRVRGILVAGVDGSMKYNSGPNQYTDAGMFFQLLKLVPRLLVNRVLHGRFLDVFLTHAAPRGIHDKQDPCHRGFKSYVWFLKTFKPRYMVHGHIHLYNRNDTRVTVFRKTTIINAYDHYILETDA